MQFVNRVTETEISLEKVSYTLFFEIWFEKVLTQIKTLQEESNKTNHSNDN